MPAPLTTRIPPSQLDDAGAFSGLRLLIADDHMMFAQGLQSLLMLEMPGIQVEIVRDGLGAVKHAVESKPDVVLMDINLPGITGIEATRRIMASGSKSLIIGLSAATHVRTVSELLDAGACGYVLKELAFEEIIDAIRTVRAGQLFLARQLRHLSGGESLGIPNRLGTRRLSGREREVLTLISLGFATKEVARKMTLSIKTIESHRRNLMAKLGIDSVAGLTRYAIQEGISPL